MGDREGMIRIGRRGFLRVAGVSLGAAAGTGLYTWRIEPHRLELVRRPLGVRGLPTPLAGRTLVQISDVHVGTRVDDGYVLATFRRITELRPDIVVFTGDFISHHARVFDRVPNIYRHFPRGRMATLAILGNHDYGPNWAQPEIAARVVEAINPFGITVLRNQVSEIDGVQVAGLDDLWAKRFDLAPVVARLDPRRAAIVLSHNPDTVDLPGWENYEGWILSGHTHGGQCKPPFLPPPLLPVRNRRYTAGEFELAGGRRLYISRGVGHLLQVRFNVRPEVTVFELRSA
jgi:predicted MPP superfamily phosphohydrolase